jgi:beta-phosphoglucomutase
MNWIRNYQLFLFDFDGLLVNTEELHYQAYIDMCTNRGFHLAWDFYRYLEAAHHEATGLRDQIYAEFPDLYKQEPDWTILYEEKKLAFVKLLKEGATQLMPGVFSLLEALQEANIKRCVVTHSATLLIDLIRSQNPILNTIPHWITREHYILPKPNPECYQLAIKQLAKEGDRIIGFEDSPRGLKALMETSAKAILICPEHTPYLQSILSSQICYYPSFNVISNENHP